MKTSKPKKMCRFQGLPPYYLPKWRYMPLQNKLPMLRNTPDGAVNFYIGDGNIGTAPWVKNKNLDFNTWDPRLLRLPCDPEYNSLRDPNLKCYFSNSRRLKLLYKQGLITREGKTCANLKDFNKYRSYLHDCSLDAIKTMQRQTECEDVHNLVVKTIVRSKEDQRAKQGGSCEDNALRARYSEILRDEMKGVCERSVTEFETTPYFREFCEGERQTLLKFRQLLLDHIKKKALIRLRRLQIFEDKQSKFWFEWMKRSRAQVQDRADYVAKEKVLNYEKCKHVREFNEYIAYRRRRIHDAVLASREKHTKKLFDLINSVRKKVCIQTHRQYPLSAQCPYNVFEGGEWGDPCPYNDLVLQLEADLYCDDQEDEIEVYPKDKPKSIGSKTSKDVHRPESEHFKEKCKDQLERDFSKTSAQDEVPSVADSLAFTIIQNAVALTIKHLRLPLACVQRTKQSKFKIIRIRYFMGELSNEVKDELADLLKNDFEILIALSQAKASKKQEQENEKKRAMESDKDTNETISKWEGAPLLRSNSQTLTGRYIREQLIRVSGRLKCEGILMEEKNQSPQAVLDQRFQAAISEASNANDLDILSCQLIDGRKAVCEAREILDALEPDQKYDKDNLVLCLISALLRTALLTIKDSLSCGAIESDDILTISSFSHKEQDAHKHIAMCKNIQDMIEKYSDDLMKNKCMEYLIRDTIRKIKCTKDTPQSDEEISKHISKAARKFVTKVIENLMRDATVKAKKEKKAKEKRKREVECEEESDEFTECEGSDSVADYNEEDYPTTFDEVYKCDDEATATYNVEDRPATFEEIYGGKESEAKYNKEDKPATARECDDRDLTAAYNEEDRPATIERETIAGYNEEDRPAAVEWEAIAVYNKEDRPATVERETIAGYNEEDRPATVERETIAGYNEEDRPATVERETIAGYNEEDRPATVERETIAGYNEEDRPATVERETIAGYEGEDSPANVDDAYKKQSGKSSKEEDGKVSTEEGAKVPKEGDGDTVEGVGGDGQVRVKGEEDSVIKHSEGDEATTYAVPSEPLALTGDA